MSEAPNLGNWAVLVVKFQMTKISFQQGSVRWWWGPVTKLVYGDSIHSQPLIGPRHAPFVWIQVRLASPHWLPSHLSHGLCATCSNPVPLLPPNCTDFNYSLLSLILQPNYRVGWTKTFVVDAQRTALSLYRQALLFILVKEKCSLLHLCIYNIINIPPPQGLSFLSTILFFS